MGRRLALLPALATAGLILTGCAGIIPAVAGETQADSVAADASALQQPATTPEPKPEGKAKADRDRTPAEPSLSAADVAPVPPAAEPMAAAAPASDPADFARFVRYVDAAAREAKGGAQLSSALLADPVALDGRRRRCAAGEQLVVVIDLDPAGGVFAPPASPAKLPGIALGLQILREAGVEIAWISDYPTERSGSVRTALEQAGLDPRGQDILSLRREEGDAKDQRRASLGGFACIVAIAGDERSDFEARFKYLRKPEAGAALEGLIGDGWFLVAPLIGN